jgi:hypothetical protein
MMFVAPGGNDCCIRHTDVKTRDALFHGKLPLGLTPAQELVIVMPSSHE